jgi:predicted porin
MASSRLGFRGVEDLGGGLKAGFWLEGALGPDTGTGSSSYGNGNTTGPGALMFRRRSTLSLSNQWGELRLGRDYTPTFWNWTVFDPFGTNGVGAATNLGLGSQIRGVTAAGDAFGTLVRANNTVQYILPAGQFGPGLYGQVQVAAGEGANGNKYYGGRIGYAAGPFDIAGAYGVTDCLNAACTIDLDTWNIAGSWNFGFMKVSGFYGSIDLSGPGAGFTRDNWFVGVSAPFGQWNFKASYGGTNGDGSGTLGSITSRDASQWAIGVDYNLSKRTALYATWSSINNDGTSFSVAAGQSALPAPGTSFNSTGGQIGVRHSF